MVKKTLLFLILVLPLNLLAQSSVNGIVYDFENKTFPLQQVAVKNLTNKQIAVTKASGQFTISAKKGDILEFSLVGYHVDTLYLTDLKPKKIFLPSNAKSLKEVAIISTKLSPYLDLENPNARESKRISTDGIEGKSNNDRAGGLQFALGYGKYKREQAKIRVLEERDAFETEIKNNFNEQTVYELIKLKGKELKDFINMFRPSVALIKSERPFNYSYYIAQAYQRWLKLPAGQRITPPMQPLKRNN
ncbi:hypothetical protein AAKU52_000067 [Pedobacter sp. CG_S7]|uniref:hypothetical protein n=1 Tax=Pedobacter sp. CG_S7 TaxID=3143930 RepID=UPI003399D1DD